MQYDMLFLFPLAALIGCAHISHQDPQTRLEITNTGSAHDSAHGAVEPVQATDPRSYKTVEQTYVPGGSVWGYAPGNVGYVPGQGFVTGSPVSTLPPLATLNVVTALPSGHQTQVTPINGEQAIVACPKNRPPKTVAEQAACAVAGVLALTESRTK